jgi:hypothetical protein
MDRPRLLLRWAQARSAQRHEVEALEEAVAGFLAQGDNEGAAEAEDGLAIAFWTRGDRATAAEHLARGVELVADAPPSAAKAGMLAAVSRFRMWAGEDRAAVEAGREALAMADELGLSEVRASVLNNIGTSRIALGDAGGLSDLQESLAISIDHKLPESIHRGHHNLAESYRRLGRLAESSAVLAEERRWDERFGLERLLLDWVTGEEAVDAYLRGDWSTALERAEAVIAAAERGVRGYMESAARVVRADIRAARDEDRGADEDSARALELARGQQDPQALAPSLACRAVLSLMWGRVAAASQLFDELTRGPLHYSAMLAAAWMAVDLRRTGELPLADAGATTPWHEPAVAIASGRIAEAADLLAAMGARSDEAYARLRTGEESQVRRALAFYRAVGATRYVREGEELLAASA